VANAILDGTDAIMLSAETAVGHYPLEAVSLMVRVAQNVEQDPVLRKHLFPSRLRTENHHSLAEGIGQAACQVAENVGASAILAFTQTGGTAALIAKYRPALPIYAVTPSAKVQQHLALYSGVSSLQAEATGGTESQIHTVEKAILKAGVMAKGEVVVITMGSPISTTGTTNLMKLHQLGNGGD
jgi:pyruvate kinase